MFGPHPRDIPRDVGWYPGGTVVVSIWVAFGVLLYFARGWSTVGVALLGLPLLVAGWLGVFYSLDSKRLPSKLQSDGARGAVCLLYGVMSGLACIVALIRL